MLRDVIRSLIAEDPTLELLGDASAADLPAALATGADVVVFGGDLVTERQAEETLRRSCSVRLIGIEKDGASATLFEMRPHRQWLGELGATRLAAVIRGAADGP